MRCQGQLLVYTSGCFFSVRAPIFNLPTRKTRKGTIKKSAMKSKHIVGRVGIYYCRWLMDFFFLFYFNGLLVSLGREGGREGGRTAAVTETVPLFAFAFVPAPPSRLCHLHRFVVMNAFLSLSFIASFSFFFSSLLRSFPFPYFRAAAAAAAAFAALVTVLPALFYKMWHDGLDCFSLSTSLGLWSLSSFCPLMI